MLPTNTQSHHGTGELKASTAQLRSIIGALPDAAFVIDHEDLVCFVNPAALGLFNLPADSLLGKPFAFSLSPNKVKQIQITRPRIKNVIAEMRTVETRWSGQKAYLVLLRDVTEKVTTEQALGESEERSRVLLHAFPDTLYLLNHDGEYVGYQARDSSMLFAPPSKFLGRKLEDVYPEDHVQLVRPLFETALKSGRPQTFEYSLDIEGEAHFFEERLVLYDKENILSLVRNITKRKQMEETSRRYSAILWAISLAAGDFMQEGFNNDTIQRMLERMGQASEVSRVYIFQNHYEDDLPVSYRLKYEWIADGVKGRLGNPALEEFPMITMLSSSLPEGRVVVRKLSELEEDERKHLEPQGIKSVLSVPIFEGDKWWGFIGFNECEEERQFAEIEIGALRTAAGIISAAIHNMTIDRALRESEVRYRGIVEDQMDFIVRWQPDDMAITFVNEAFCRYFGGTREEWIGKTVQDNIVQDDVSEAYEYGLSLDEEKPSGFHEHRNVNHKGEIRWCQWRDRVILGDQGKGVEIQSVGRDIHEAKMRAREMEGMAVIAAALRGTLSRQETLDVIVDNLMELIGARGVAIGFWMEDEKETLTFEAGRGVLNVLGGKTMQKESLFAYAQDKTGSVYGNYEDLYQGGQKGMFVPLVVEEHDIGAILVGNNRVIAEDEERTLKAVADIAASAVHRVTLYEATKRRLNRVMAMRTLSLTMSGDIDLEISFEVLVEQVTEHFGVDAASVLVVNPETLEFSYSVSRGFKTKKGKAGALSKENILAGEVFRTRQAMFVKNVTEDSRLSKKNRRVLEEEEFYSYYALPMIAKGEVKGVLEVFSRGFDEPSEEWKNLMETLTADAAMAIDHAKLFGDLQNSNEELKTAYDETIWGWSKALEMRDKETQGHSERVVELTVELARRMGVWGGDIPALRRGAILHDIGKMGVPDSILLKPRPLSPEEWETMSKHPEFAYQMLSAIPFLRDSLEIPYCHHERWDGSGYPRGLKEEDIPLAARIFSVVDVWDAVTSDRPYREAWTREKAYQYIEENSGFLFDPHVVEAFLKMMDEEEM